jgi:hypothetical protein
MWDWRFISGVVITSAARNLLLLGLERSPRKQQIPQGLKAVRDDNSQSRIRILLLQYSMRDFFIPALKRMIQVKRFPER